jgi:predicted GNAT family acetyltransferase
MTMAVEHDRMRRRYTLVVDGRRSSFADYQLLDGGRTVLFHHTVTPVPDRGQGFAAELVGRALDDVRASGRKVVATCWYVDEYLEAHAEYHDLLT